jgi:hypothetical protein
MLKRIRTADILFPLTLLWIALTVVPVGAAVPQHPHGRDCTTAREISLNSDVTSMLATTTDYVVYRLSLEQRGLLDVWVDAAAPNTWGMELLDSSCRLIANVIADVSLVSGRWAEITVPHRGLISSDASIWTLAPGAYFVRIRRNPFDAFQARLTFHTKFVPHYGHDCDTAEFLKIPGRIDGRMMYADDREVFRVTTTQTGRIHAWTTGPETARKEPLVKLSVANCSGKPELRVCNDTTRLVTPVLPPGTYYFSAEPRQPRYLGRYTLHVDFEEVQTDITMRF